ncbi:hypothetical protein fHeYen902_244 [Yersinia phage fHe-Yen9-02]|nr:hypothetical protein fHeYen902_244 [Yersinia phage fHe-Yen9-02]
MFTYRRKIEGDATRVVYSHPVHKDYGVAFSIAESRDQITCLIVNGSIDGHTPLIPVTDLSAPLVVLAWAAQVILVIENNTVNEESIDIENLITHHGGKFVYARSLPNVGE